jgi:hypothetical protein
MGFEKKREAAASKDGWRLRQAKTGGGCGKQRRVVAAAGGDDAAVVTI